jgi:hypothetical protein
MDQLQRLARTPLLNSAKFLAPKASGPADSSSAAEAEEEAERGQRIPRRNGPILPGFEP